MSKEDQIAINPEEQKRLRDIKKYSTFAVVIQNQKLFPLEDVSKIHEATKTAATHFLINSIIGIALNVPVKRLLGSYGIKTSLPSRSLIRIGLFTLPFIFNNPQSYVENTVNEIHSKYGDKVSTFLKTRNQKDLQS